MQGQYFDFIILGAGASGMLLAREMLRSRLLDNKSLLIIDKEAKQTNDRTWSWWDPALQGQVPICSSYHTLAFRALQTRLRLPIKDEVYHITPGLAFYQDTLAQLADHTQATFLQADVGETYTDKKQGQAHIKTSAGNFTTSWAFDSRIQPLSSYEKLHRYTFLWQHFYGYVVETQEDVFDSKQATLFDFSIPQQDEVRFVYTLPYAPNKALVEYTVFGPDVYDRAFYKERLEKYLSKNKRVGAYRVVEAEEGKIPMTDFPFPTRKRKDHILPIGTSAGKCKPSTGYAFARSAREARHIVRQLEHDKRPTNLSSPLRFRLYDAMILHLMDQKGGQIQYYFTDLFSKVPTDRLLRFLDERTTFWEELTIMNTVPKKPFVQALWWVIRRGLAI